MEQGLAPTSILTYAQPSAGSASGASAPRRKHRLLGALALVLVILVIVTWALATARKGDLSEEGDLARNGWEVYLRQGCGYCDKQMALLGGFKKYVRYGPDGTLLGGHTKTPTLGFDSVSAFPLWRNERTGETRVGFQDASALKYMGSTQ